MIIEQTKVAAHTPGPWRVIHKPEAIGFAEYEVAWSDDGELVCDVVYEEADAHLIAAAPDLLDAVKSLLPWAESASYGGPDIAADIEQARTAIAKALGEEHGSER
jgi:hypothetical protein